MINLSGLYLWKANNYSQTCPKRTRTCYVTDIWLLQTPFRDRRCPLWASLTVLIKLVVLISKKFSNYLQIPEYLLHLITIIIDIINCRQVDNKVNNK